MPAKKATTKAGSKKTMSNAHKAALASGREHGRIVRDYLEALEANKPKRGRKRTPESIAARLEAIGGELESSSAIGRLLLIQEQSDLAAELAQMESKVDLGEYEEAFIEVAAEYGERKGLGYAAWRSVGVSAAVLKQAGIGRAS